MNLRRVWDVVLVRLLSVPKFVWNCIFSVFFFLVNTLSSARGGPFLETDSSFLLIPTIS